MQALSKRVSSGAHASTSGRGLCRETGSLRSSFLPYRAVFPLLRSTSFYRGSRYATVIANKRPPITPCRAFVSKKESDHDRARGGCLIKPWPGILSAAKYVQNDAIILDERAKNDLHLLQRGFVQLDTKARQDVALLESRFHGQVALPLDARAKADARRLRHIVLGLEASFELAGKEHWSNGALTEDLRLADMRARRRLMEDTYAAASSMKALQEGLTRLIRAKTAAKKSARRKMRSRPRGVRLSPAEQVAEVQAAYLEVIGDLAQSEETESAEDSEELELIVATLLDFNEVDGGSGAVLVTKASQSPDAATRRALAEALSAAPSLWALGNAGISALERLSSDRNKLVARAAKTALEVLRGKWDESGSNGLLYVSLGSEGTEEDLDGRGESP